jgi:hypothetical protein
MEALPLDIVVEIAWALSSTSDMRNFRLVNKAFAYAVSPVLFRHVQAINTIGCLSQLHNFQHDREGPASATRHLTLHHATWPQLESFDAWQTHPQALNHADLPIQAQVQAFSAYRQFTHQEVARNFETDLYGLAKILDMFPSLTSLTVSHVHNWRWGRLKSDYYDELCQTIRIIPFFKARVEHLTSRLLPILPRFPQITRLSIPSTLDIEDDEWVVRNDSIVSLDVSNLVVRGYDHVQVHKFLRSFRNLQELILSTESGGQISEQRIALWSLHWPNLRRLHLRHLWTSEDDLISFIERHQLEQLALRNVTLVDSSWESFFVRLSSLTVRPFQSAVCITGAGIRIPLKEAATSYSRWPSGHASALRPRVYVLFSGVDHNEQGSSSNTDYNNDDFWFKIN